MVALSVEEFKMAHVTLAECDAALPHVLEAPKEAAIEVLCHRPDFGQRDYRDALELRVATGIENERWMKHPWMKLEDGSPDPRIQVSILQKRVLDLCWRDRDEVVYPGDTMIADMDLGEENLPAGTRLQAGTAILEVSDVFNTACAKWKVRHGRESFDWINKPENVKHRLRGALCSIVQDGVVRKGDILRKL
ncbi:hypothetical protein GCM10011498_15240 [Amylibacter cionae]|uniref:MOSC domain-containing protein n=2 Tax=Neptunicoccus cionae TaxID=2035344 RepID=A0A916VP98_9RHOB|nr:hypothetical protein GCM10011498_15240 [Amylibacter cionae]